jgi:PIN domain nuclease of toxin-antitoxin system
VSLPSTLVLDASALVAYARNEPGAQVVAERLRAGGRIVVSAVNWAEAAGKLREYGMTPALLRHALEAVDSQIVAFGEVDADLVAERTPGWRPLGLSLGDRACLALALSIKAPVLTAERSWSRLDLDGVVVEQIRIEARPGASEPAPLGPAS